MRELITVVKETDGGESIVIEAHVSTRTIKTHATLSERPAAWREMVQGVRASLVHATDLAVLSTGTSKESGSSSVSDR